TAFPSAIERAAALVGGAQRPVIVVGSQTLLQGPDGAHRLREALEQIGAPVYLSGMARGLLGARHPLLRRHKRGAALREADVVVLAGVPCDFRLEYGLSIGRKAKLVALNRSEDEAKKNRRPTLALVADPCDSLLGIAREITRERNGIVPWLDRLLTRDREREDEIATQADAPTATGVHPLRICRAIDERLPEDSVLVADGGDFVATASYTTAPRGPLSWLDPGVFGTLGVGAGFALGAKLVRPSAEVWLLWGDGSAGYGLAELDTFVRHGLGIVAVVGNDASWAQIARDQVQILGDDVGTVLRLTDYDRVAEGFGARGLPIRRPEDADGVLREAQAIAGRGTAVLVNVHLAPSDFRKGSISM
ncbi:MAG TPA: thiamine pyrophosphate-dependent enzyme, partial [Nannocystaceae bacterium]|nr:thiamine pyrophosphate-dependent enzyme [Nannocystaceae bacterium]